MHFVHIRVDNLNQTCEFDPVDFGIGYKCETFVEPFALA